METPSAQNAKRRTELLQDLKRCFNGEKKLAIERAHTAIARWTAALSSGEPSITVQQTVVCADTRSEQ